MGASNSMINSVKQIYPEGCDVGRIGVKRRLFHNRKLFLTFAKPTLFEVKQHKLQLSNCSRRSIYINRSCSDYGLYSTFWFRVQQGWVYSQEVSLHELMASIISQVHKTSTHT